MAFLPGLLSNIRSGVSRVAQGIGDLFSKLPFRKVRPRGLQKGTLVAAQYLFWKHDPSPLILVTGVYADRITGINLHYWKNMSAASWMTLR